MWLDVEDKRIRKQILRRRKNRTNKQDKQINAQRDWSERWKIGEDIGETEKEVSVQAHRRERDISKSDEQESRGCAPLGSNESDADAERDSAIMCGDTDERINNESVKGDLDQIQVPRCPSLN